MRNSGAVSVASASATDCLLTVSKRLDLIETRPAVKKSVCSDHNTQEMEHSFGQTEKEMGHQPDCVCVCVGVCMRSDGKRSYCVRRFVLVHLSNTFLTSVEESSSETGSGLFQLTLQSQFPSSCYVEAAFLRLLLL